MKISTRGRYALRVMIDLAEHADEKEYIAMKDIAKRQGLSLKYVEKILPQLVKGNLIKGVHGKGGGYKLLRKPEEYTVDEVLRLTEGEMAPVSCLECDAEACDRRESCRTLEMWVGLYDLIRRFFSSITIADLMEDNSLIMGEGAGI
ncbi:MAG: Rrf2 family transcriptional regulator [Lachnospiraceae bacterium]|nr:Rrf2 family transcriptional regulator [Lachnospiraceae bacterium]